MTPACMSKPAEWWHPLPTDYETGEAAQRVCNTCPMKTRCRDDAVTRGEEHGVWGGVWFDRGPTRRKLLARKPTRTTRSHCLRGHELSPENVSADVDAKGRVHRRCLECRREEKRRRLGYKALTEPVFDPDVFARLVDGREVKIPRGHKRLYAKRLLDAGWGSNRIQERLRCNGDVVRTANESGAAA